jgi:hypothetical protein
VGQRRGEPSPLLTTPSPVSCTFDLPSWPNAEEEEEKDLPSSSSSSPPPPPLLLLPSSSSPPPPPLPLLLITPPPLPFRYSPVKALSYTPVITVGIYILKYLMRV